jgi:hypothetical protein
MSGGTIRIGDAEREAAIAALGDHFAAGRLTRVEHDERVAAALAARTNSDLAALFADLPVVGREAAPPVRGFGLPRGLPVLLRIVLLVAVVFVLVHLLPVLIAIGVVVLASRLIFGFGYRRMHRGWSRGPHW